MKIIKLFITYMRGIAISVGFVVLLILLLYVIQEVQQDESQPIVLQLGLMENNLKSINQQLQQKQSSTSLQFHVMEEKLNALAQRINMIDLSSHTKQLQDFITKENETMLQRLQTLHIPMQSMPTHKRANTVKLYLPQSALPFHVANIDLWNGEPLCTIMVDGRATVMAKHDNYKGWTLITVTFNPARAIFVNAKNQIVKVYF
jgi:TolA-binding protein